MQLRRLMLLVCFSGFAAAPLAQADPVLEGSWKSDRELTMAFLNKHVKLRELQVESITQLMGRLVMTFTDGKLSEQMPDFDMTLAEKQVHFKGYTFESPYRIVFSNQDEVAAVSNDLFPTGQEKIWIYHFDSPDVMWVYVEGAGPKYRDMHLREYFRRLSSPPGKAK